MVQVFFYTISSNKIVKWIDLTNVNAFMREAILIKYNFNRIRIWKLENKK